ncbi:MAG TPA: aminoglycoside phosphotransferase family protein [Caulobacteraceae bacterium]|nr:aminoglycoside phosphotransferase family protein [Caulobacteraceae bacterium]
MTSDPARFDPRAIDESLVRRLLSAQFPAWAGLPVRAADPQGNDNRTFRLGEDLLVRLPSHRRYVAQVEKEQTWLPRLAPHLPLAIPTPVAAGAPGEGYPWPWSVYRWLAGETAGAARIADSRRLAVELANFLRALQAIDTTGGPLAGPHSHGRGGPLTLYDAQASEAIAALGVGIDSAGASAVWKAALAVEHEGAPVWVHGDLAADNLLVDASGRLSAVLDFGCSAVGDPACDLVIAWTFFTGQTRDAFRAALGLDAGTWARGRGWALWKALITLAADGAGAVDHPGGAAVIASVLAEHRELR